MPIPEEYQKALDYLYSYVDFSLTKVMRYTDEQFDLGRMREFTAALGNPQAAYPSLHVAGTKGKGSVSALCASALHASGYRVGLYTSPHLHDYTERIQVNRQSMPHEDLIHLLEEMKPVIESIPKLTTFEITTALAFKYFQHQKVDVAVFEVGLGGRLDATNVVTPRVCVITSISYDHTQILGETLAKIAGEKAGIIKEGVPVVVAPQKDEARKVIERIAAECKAPLIEIDRQYSYAAGGHSLNGQNLRVWQTGQENRSIDLSIPLLGLHQVENAATALATLRTFSDLALPVSDEAIRSGFATTSWPGRFEVLQAQPTLLVDSAHNRDSALRLRQALDDYFPRVPVILLFGASEDKDIEGIFAELKPRIKSVVVVKSFHPRACEPERLVEIATKHGKPAQLIPDIPEALQEALRIAGDDCMVLATGSIFVVAAVREAWAPGKFKN
jgi:dihydrofolate synthase/folylpolyglutamate synthase